jgi:Bacterial PH domain
VTPDGTAPTAGTRTGDVRTARVRSALRRRSGPPVLDPDGGAAAGPVLVLRPRRVRVVAWACAVPVVAVFAVVGVLLPDTDTGVYFRAADQVAMLLLGLLIAAGILLLARPRVRADARGIEVRNVGLPRYLPWSQVQAVSFTDGASWARLDLPYDEYLAVMAVQAVDGAHAVAGMRRLRALHAAAHPTAEPRGAGAPGGANAPGEPDGAGDPTDPGRAPGAGGADPDRT